MSYHLSVYLDDELHAALQDFAARRGKSLSIIAVAAIASFLSPDTAERLERDLGISVEMLALFVRFWLAATPSVPETAQAAARAKGRERYEGFVEALGRRLASGKLFAREVSFERSSDPVPYADTAQTDETRSAGDGPTTTAMRERR